MKRTHLGIDAQVHAGSDTGESGKTDTDQPARVAEMDGITVRVFVEVSSISVEQNGIDEGPATRATWCVASDYAGKTLDGRRSDCVLSALSAEEAVEMAATFL